MRAVDQWRLIEADLPEGWEEAHLSFAVEDPATVRSAAAVLGPLGPGRVGDELRFQVQPSGSGGAQKLANLLGHLDRKRVWGTLALREAKAASPAVEAGAGADEAGADETGTAEAGSAPEPARGQVRPQERQTLVRSWDALLETLPPDWSDLLCTLELDSTDYVASAALLGAPLNPARVPHESSVRFRASSTKGYGASPLMVRRCFERMDAEGVTGRLEVVNALSDTENVGTQGPVWRVAGRSV